VGVPQNRKTALRRSFQNLFRCFDKAAAIAAAFFRFLRRTSRPSALGPVAMNGGAAGLRVARLGRIRLSDIAGWPLINIARRMVLVDEGTGRLLRA
jgi:hypothetical protein